MFIELINLWIQKNFLIISDFWKRRKWKWKKPVIFSIPHFGCPFFLCGVSPLWNSFSTPRLRKWKILFFIHFKLVLWTYFHLDSLSKQHINHQKNTCDLWHCKKWSYFYTIQWNFALFSHMWNFFNKWSNKLHNN